MNDTEEYTRWEDRYGIRDYLFGKAPNAFLQSSKALLPAGGRALAVADGEGRNGVWLAEQERGVAVEFLQADVHAFDYPDSAFDLVVEIFTQFSTPAERVRKWAGMRRALKPGGLLILQGYTPKQLDYGTGGPKQVELLYTRPMLEQAFGDWKVLRLVEEEREMHEGAAHSGMSAVIGLVARKP
jgi:SAM-dependent methyltransferase